MRPILITATAGLLIALAACGQSGPLRPAPGAGSQPAAPPAPAQLPPGAQKPATETLPGSPDYIRR